MKKIYLLFAAVMLSAYAHAQWNAVRFDQINYFMEAHAISANAVMVTGVDAMMTASFILRTQDAGVTWDSIVLNNSMGNYLLDRMTFTDFYNGYAGGRRDMNQALLKTTDNGSNWNDITPDPLSPDMIKALSFYNQNEGYAASENNIYKTVDGGTTWNTVTPPPAIIRDISFSGIVTGYAGGESGALPAIYKTTDGGLSWNSVFAGTANMFTPSVYKIDLISASTIYASMLYSNALVRTTDGGLSWDTLVINQIYDITDFEFTSLNTGHVLSSMGEIYVTTDGGVTWTLEYATASGAYGPFVFLSSITFVENDGYVCGSSGLIKKHDPNVTGITATENQEMQAYPNPVSAGAILRLDRDYEIIRIQNTLGELIREAQVFNRTIELQDLRPGTYILSGRDLSQWYHSPIIITE